MEDTNKEDLKSCVFDRIDRLTRRIEVIEFMLKAIQDREYHLRFCYKDETAFAGEAKMIEHDLLRGYEKYVLGKLKQKLHEEEKSLDVYDRILTGKNKK